MLAMSLALFVGTAFAQVAFADDGRAFTGWAFIFNQPSKCDGPCDGVNFPADLCAAKGNIVYLTGQRVEDGKRAIFAGQISKHSKHRVIDVCGTGNGLKDPVNAEIHIGLDDHCPGSLDGAADEVHAEVTTPGDGIRQFATFLSGAMQGVVSFAGGNIPVPGSSAYITRAHRGVSISIDTTIDFVACN